MTTNKYSEDDVTAAINTAARRMIDTPEPHDLRARVMARVAVTERRSLAWGWRLALAGGSISAAVIIGVALWNSSAVPVTTVAPTQTSAQANPTLASSAHPTEAMQPSSPVVSTASTRRARILHAVTVSAAELEWRERAVPALEAIDPLHVEPLTHESIGIESIDIAPLVVAPLTVTAIR